MYAKIVFPYGSIITEEKVEESEEKIAVWVTPKEDYIRLRELIPELPTPEEVEKDGFVWGEYTAHLESVLNIVSKVDIRSIIRNTSASFDDLEEKLSRINRYLSEVEVRSKAYHDQLLNKKIDVHVPGNELLNISEVIYVVDACTNEIQMNLEEGWRIIAVCPQPDQRRPDYILGRVESSDKEKC